MLAGLVLLLAFQLGLGRRASRGATSKAEAPWSDREKEARERMDRFASMDRRELMARIEANPSLRWRFLIGIGGMGLVLFGVGYQALRLLARLILRRPGSRPRRPLFDRLGSPLPPAWGGRPIVRLLLVAGILFELLVLAESLVITLYRPPWLDRLVASLAATLWVDGIIAVGAARLLLRRGRPPMDQIQQPDRDRALKSIRFGVGFYLACLPLIFLILLAVAMVMDLLNHPPTPQAVFTLYLSETRGPVLGWLIALVTVIGPVAEELFFRGLLYGWLRVRIGVLRGLLASAVLFALLHVDGTAFFPILGLGLVFGWVYERTGSLAAPIAIHVLHNVGMLYMASLVKSAISLS